MKTPDDYFFVPDRHKYSVVIAFVLAIGLFFIFIWVWLRNGHYLFIPIGVLCVFLYAWQLMDIVTHMFKWKKQEVLAEFCLDPKLVQIAYIGRECGNLAYLRDRAVDMGIPESDPLLSEIDRLIKLEDERYPGLGLSGRAGVGGVDEKSEGGG